METIRTFMINHAEEILKGVIETTLGAFFIAMLTKVVSIIRKKTLKMLPESEKAIYLNKPEKTFEDNCIGREKLLKKVFNKIRDGKNNFFTRKCIAIIGEEGIGKTLFCYTLFKYYLREYSVYLGWIECNGKQSIFDIIKATFEISDFHRKNKDKILMTLNNMEKPCILFVDQVDQYTPIAELEELSHCSNVILIVSGLFKIINFIDDLFIITPFGDKIVRKIFEKHSNEEFNLMEPENEEIVKNLLEYAHGNPFLVKAIAKAKCHYDGKWENVLENIKRCEYEDEDYLKSILRRLYKINKLDVVEIMTLSKLSTIKYTNFVKAVFSWLDISDYYVKRLCNTYWLTQEDSILYSMDIFHRDIIAKILTFEVNLDISVIAIDGFLLKWNTYEDKGFKWISPYIEDILKKIQGYAPHIMDNELFPYFTYKVASRYHNIRDQINIRNQIKSLLWIELCNPKDDITLVYRKTCTELRIKNDFVGILFSSYEIKQKYLDFLEKTKTIDIFKKHERHLIEEYCCFLIGEKQYDEALSLCKKYFEDYDKNLSNSDNCDMFYRYLQAAYLKNDEETLKLLVNDLTIHELYQHEDVSISVAWTFGILSNIYAKLGDEKSSETYMRHMVVLLNKQRCFFHGDLQQHLKFSDEEFAEYMHSCEELLESLNDALNREDVGALYIEGRYQEKHRNFDKAFSLYEKAATKDSLSGMCSLALLYYRGQGVFCDYDKAQKYWNYCCERGHRGSYYWLGILLLDTNYKKMNKKVALQHLTKAAELGSERAKEKLLEIEKSL